MAGEEVAVVEDDDEAAVAAGEAAVTAGEAVAGADGAAGADDAAAETAGADAVAAPLASTVRMTEPCLTLSPNFTFKAVTTPACDEGISIDALSLSTVIKL